MSNWQTEKAERNRKSFARLSKALPAIFPPTVLSPALDRPPFIPPTPRLAIVLGKRRRIRIDLLRVPSAYDLQDCAPCRRFDADAVNAKL